MFGFFWGSGNVGSSGLFKDEVAIIRQMFCTSENYDFFLLNSMDLRVLGRVLDDSRITIRIFDNYKSRK